EWIPSSVVLRLDHICMYRLKCMKIHTANHRHRCHHKINSGKESYTEPIVSVSDTINIRILEMLDFDTNSFFVFQKGGPMNIDSGRFQQHDAFTSLVDIAAAQPSLPVPKEEPKQRVGLPRGM